MESLTRVSESATSAPESLPLDDLITPENLDHKCRAITEEILRVYTEIEYFGFRSAVGRMVVDFERLRLRGTAARCLTCGKTKPMCVKAQRHAANDAPHDFASASAPPAARLLVGESGVPLRVTASRRDVAELTRGVTTRVTRIQTEREAQLWKATVAVMGGKLDPEAWRLLKRAAELKTRRLPAKNRLAQLERQLGSVSGRKRFGKDIGRAREERDRLWQTDANLKAQRYKLVRDPKYGPATQLYVLVCCLSGPETQAYCFREKT